MSLPPSPVSISSGLPSCLFSAHHPELALWAPELPVFGPWCLPDFFVVQSFDFGDPPISSSRFAFPLLLALLPLVSENNNWLSQYDSLCSQCTYQHSDCSFVMRWPCNPQCCACVLKLGALLRTTCMLACSNFHILPRCNPINCIFHKWHLDQHS